MAATSWLRSLDREEGRGNPSIPREAKEYNVHINVYKKHKPDEGVRQDKRVMSQRKKERG